MLYSDYHYAKVGPTPASLSSAQGLVEGLSFCLPLLNRSLFPQLASPWYRLDLERASQYASKVLSNFQRTNRRPHQHHASALHMLPKHAQQKGDRSVCTYGPNDRLFAFATNRTLLLQAVVDHQHCFAHG